MTILTQIIEAETTREVDSIVTKNIYNIDSKSRNFLCSFANKRKRNILRIEREKKESWKPELN
jgi:hypothetical protein